MELTVTHNEKMHTIHEIIISGKSIYCVLLYPRLFLRDINDYMERSGDGEL